MSDYVKLRALVDRWRTRSELTAPPYWPRHESEVLKACADELQAILDAHRHEKMTRPWLEGHYGATTETIEKLVGPEPPEED